MGPNISAANDYVGESSERAIITSLQSTVDASNGKTGPIILPE